MQSSVPDVPQGFDQFGPWFNETIKLWTDQVGTWLAITLVAILVVTVLTLVVCIGWLAAIYVVPVMIGGMMLASLRQARGESISVGDLFSGGPFWIGALVFVLLYSVGSTIAYIGAALVVGFLFLFLPLHIDRGLAIGDALSASIAVTGKNFALFFLFALVLVLLSLLIIPIPWLYIGMAVAYKHLYGTPAAQPMVIEPATPPEEPGEENPPA